MSEGLKRAAARAAGFKVDTPPPTIVRRVWKRVSSQDRETVAGTKVLSRIPATLRRCFRWRNPLIPYQRQLRGVLAHWYARQT